MLQTTQARGRDHGRVIGGKTRRREEDRAGETPGQRGPAQPGVIGAFYSSDPRLGVTTPICTTSTKQTLAPGACWEGTQTLRAVA